MGEKHKSNPVKKQIPMTEIVKFLMVKIGKLHLTIQKLKENLN